METSLLALSTFLQHELDILVILAEFFPGGAPYNPIDKPCSLITLEPFAPGGLRRLALNVRAPLSRRAAQCLQKGQTETVCLLGQAMVRTCSWPIQHIDSPASVNWGMTARGLIATPHALCTWPVPHQELEQQQEQPRGQQPSLYATTQLVIWPYRICAVCYESTTRGDPSADNKPTLRYVSEIWHNRDAGLYKEFENLQIDKRLSSRLFCRRRKRKQQVPVASSTSLLTFAPSLPVFCVADALVQSGRVPRHSALAEAADWLIQTDRLFALSCFFGVPLMDRTQTLPSLLRLAQLTPPPPTQDEIAHFLHSVTSQDVHSVFRSIMLERAQELWLMTERREKVQGEIYVAWSGGIDSTAVLCAFLETAQRLEGSRRTRRLRILLDEESIAENPTFYRSHVAGVLKEVPRNDKPLSWHASRIRKHNASSMLVTGELGDQLFGSDRCNFAFPDVYGKQEELPKSLAKNAPQPPPSEYQGIFVEKGLAAPWEETILPSLASVNLIAEGGFQAWKEWIKPQLAIAPFPIVSTFDFLWWINFSMKWQNVSLRCLHDGGAPLLEHADRMVDLTGCIRHFYDDRKFECWSSVKEFHDSKFPDLTVFKTYKEPLKYFIREFDGNDEYYREKMKVWSLCFGAPKEPDSYVNRFYGVVVDLIPEPKHSRAQDGVPKDMAKMDPLSRPRLLSWGACGMVLPETGELSRLLTPDGILATESYPSGICDVLQVDPWSDQNSPFDVAPYFAEADERQRRIFNPVSKVTLIGKCSALLEPEIIYGRTFLDLGACLAASSYWALCMGAAKVTAVEVQESFCSRAQEMLEQAEASSCWPSSSNGDRRFEVICCGVREYLEEAPDRSHDVVLAAGILHCFVDPIQVLVDMARVASHAVLIEMTHAGCYQEGNLQDPDLYNSIALMAEEETDILTSSSRSRGLKAAVRPLPKRVEAAGLLQVAPRALVNMADTEASFQGLAIVPSRIAIETLMKNLGFKVSRVFLKRHPTMDDDVRTYTGAKKYRALSTRYFLRCVREKDVDTVAPSSLESLIVTNDKSKQEAWLKAKSWFSFDAAENGGIASGNDPAANTDANHHSSTRKEELDDPKEEWKFDATVAARFKQEAKCHIPDYGQVIEDSIRMLETFLGENKEKKNTIKVVDYGCATGCTLVRLLQRGFQNVHGVDVSSAMLAEAKENLRKAGYLYESGTRLHLNESALDLPTGLTDTGELDAVFCNWTLHFVCGETERRTLLQNMANHMARGALLVLTEKTLQNEETQKAYYGFKNRMGVSDKEIATKKARLKGVLQPFGIEWYLKALADIGFVDVSIFRARYGFVTFVARRQGVASGTVKISRPLDSFQVWPDFSARAEEIQYVDKESIAPFAMRAWGKSTNTAWSGGIESGTVYGYVYEDQTTLTLDPKGAEPRSFTLYEGMYFACPGMIQLQGGSGILQLVKEHQALFAIGGPLEEGEGRLPYIDGCSDSLLLAPAVKGAPCLNHLHFPKDVIQTKHTHPSGRSGIVVRGRGTCVVDSGNKRMPLEPGVAFVIPTNVLHAFETTENEELDVIAFHPDSDFGPSFDDHPMINRTMVNGLSAAKVSSIRTKVSDEMPRAHNA